MKPEQNTVILLASSTWFPISARIAIAFLGHGCSVSGICPEGHPLSFVPGMGTLYPYTGWRSLHALHRAILAAKPDLVVPCDDGVATQLHQLHATQPELRPLIERSLGDPASYATLNSRDLFLHTAASLGIRVPPVRTVASISDLDNWPYPTAVLKTDGSTGGHGVIIAHTLPAIRAAFHQLRHPLTAITALKRFLVNRDPLALWRWRWHSTPNVVAQQFIPGRPANTMLACWQGEILASVTAETLCSQGSTGAATIIRLFNHPEIDEASRKLAQHLHLSGFYGLDFILEDKMSEGNNGQRNTPALPAAHLLEINPRCTQLGHLTLPGQGDLAGILAAKLSGIAPPALIDSPVHGDTVAFYPQAQLWNPQSPYLTTGYHDVPLQAPALAADLLLEEWPYRQWPARLYHHLFPPPQPQEANVDHAIDSPRDPAPPLPSL